MPRQKSKAEIIDERKADLPLPEDPPVASDWNSVDERNVNIARGSKDSEIATRAAAETSINGVMPPAREGSGIREEREADLNEIGREVEVDLLTPKRER